VVRDHAQLKVRGSREKEHDKQKLEGGSKYFDKKRGVGGLNGGGRGPHSEKLERERTCIGQRKKRRTQDQSRFTRK